MFIFIFLCRKFSFMIFIWVFELFYYIRELRCGSLWICACHLTKLKQIKTQKRKYLWKIKFKGKFTTNKISLLSKELPCMSLPFSSFPNDRFTRVFIGYEREKSFNILIGSTKFMKQREWDLLNIYKKEFKQTMWMWKKQISIRKW